MLEYLTDELQTIISNAETVLSNAHGNGAAHTAAAVSCALLGISDAVDGYRAMPDVHPRTVRRICAESHMLLSVGRTDVEASGETPIPAESKTAFSIWPKKIVRSDSSKDLDSTAAAAIASAAKKAGVPRITAHLAATYFRNPLERVMEVLEDLAALQNAGGTVKPAALFTWLMRRPSEAVKLPVAVLEHREAQLERIEAEQRAAAVSTPGVITLWFGRTRAVVLEVSQRIGSAVIEVLEDTSDGYAGSQFTVPIAQLRPMT